MDESLGEQCEGAYLKGYLASLTRRVAADLERRRPAIEAATARFVAAGRLPRIDPQDQEL